MTPDATNTHPRYGLGWPVGNEKRPLLLAAFTLTARCSLGLRYYAIVWFAFGAFASVSISERLDLISKPCQVMLNAATAAITVSLSLLTMVLLLSLVAI
jgi:hypothetical protein